MTASLASASKRKIPRGAWKTKVVEGVQLLFVKMRFQTKIKFILGYSQLMPLWRGQSGASSTFVG